MNSPPAVEVLDAASSRDVHRWDDLVDQSPVPDVYYRPGYVRAGAGTARAVAVVLHAEGTRVMFPLLLRPLSENPWAADETRFDAITPYGYGGLLPLSDGDITPASVQAAVLELQRWCSRNDIVACLVRLHPLLGQSALCSGWAPTGIELKRHGPTTAADLLHWDEAAGRPAAMKPRRRSYLAACRRTLELATALPGSPGFAAHLQTFVALYEHTMQQLNAASSYFFPKSYYEALADSLGDRLVVMLATRGPEAVGGALFFFDRHFGHYHLGGWNDAGRELRASTFLLAAGAAEGRQRGCRLLHLGGGVQGDDSLFQFKRSFGGPVFEYAYLTVIADEGAYRALVEQRLQQSDLPPVRPNFFPAYRA